MRSATDPLSATFFALADPTRRAILARLARGAATVKELAAPFRVSGPAVSKHLRVLERTGLVRRGREAQWRPRTLDAAPLEDVAEWAAEFRRFWDTSYERAAGDERATAASRYCCFSSTTTTSKGPSRSM